MVMFLWTSSVSDIPPDKRDYRNLGIGERPDDGKAVYPKFGL